MKGEYPKNIFRRVLASLLLLVFAVGFSGSLLLSNPKPAYAQFSVPITDLQTTVSNIWNTLKDNFVGAVVTSVINGANYFLSKLAYDLAVNLTSGCNGQVVCWNTKSFEQGIGDAWKGTIGEVVETFSEEGGFNQMGLNLCQPDVNVALNIQLGILNEVQPPEEPSCNWQSFRDSWESIGDQFSSEEVLGNFENMFRPGQSDLSITLGALDVSETLKANKIRDEGLNRLTEAVVGGGFSNITDPVSGRILAPGSTVKAAWDQMKKEKEEDPKETSSKMNAAQIARGAFGSVLMNFAQTFAQTFLGRLWNNFTQGLISSEEAIQAQPSIVLSEEGLFRAPGKKIVAQTLTKMLAAPQRDVGEVDPLVNFITCPNQNRVADNCVMDGQFANTVRAAATTPFTVQQAIKEGGLHGEWPLIPASDPRNQDPNCYNTGYCESNLKKLRAARVIPIGWEIAASLATGAYQNVKLQDVVNAFKDCNATGERDTLHPFCHLIDPNWILLAPAAQCRVQAYGPELMDPTIPQRSQKCVDMRTCLKADDFGRCIGGWGYCTREKNVWRMNATQCPAEFNTCRTLTPADSKSTPINYLVNTLDFGICNADNVGCAQYATNLNAVTCVKPDGCTRDDGCPMEASVSKGDTQHTARFCTSSTCVMGADYQCSMSSACTLDGGCNIGCKIAKGQTSCTSLTGHEDDKSDDWLVSPARFFNSKADGCDARDNGCTSLVQLGYGQSFNLLDNGGFETVDNNGGLQGWLLPAGKVSTAQTGYLEMGNPVSVIEGNNAVLLSSRVPLSTSVCSDTDTCLSNGDHCQCTHSGFSCQKNVGDNKCLIGSRVLSKPISIRPGKMYTVSAAFRSPNQVASVKAEEIVNFFDATGAAVSPMASGTTTIATTPIFSAAIKKYDLSQGGSPGSCNPSHQDDATTCNPCYVAAASPLGDSTADLILHFNSHADGTRQIPEIRAACSFYVTNPDVVSASVELRNVTPFDATNDNNGARTIYADAVQLEEGPLTPFHSGYNSQSIVNVKLAPDYLKCTGETGDLKECAAFANVCRETEVGCERYTPASGDPAIPGIVSSNDYCPAECVDYDMFFQEPTDFESFTGVSAPIDFIPSTAKQCAVKDVGCTSFTNVETEQIENYSRLRICQNLSASDNQTFYTWEGSDTTGYQLRAWQFKKTGSSAPLGIKADGTSVGADLNQATDVCANPGCSDVGRAPCARLNTGGTSCNDNPGADARTGFCSKADIDAGDYDCREFYDASGNRHYRRLSQIIIATDDCHQYRISGRSSAADCQKWNGIWDGVRAECIYNASSGLSLACSASVAGCRSYRGNAASNIQTIFVEDFENDIVSRWTGGIQSSESLVAGGHSVHLSSAVGGLNIHREIGANVAGGNLYKVSFWARGNGDLTVNIGSGENTTCCLGGVEEGRPACPADGGACGCTVSQGLNCEINPGSSDCTVPAATFNGDPSLRQLVSSLRLTSDWRRYEIGLKQPLNAQGVEAGRTSVFLNFIASGSSPDVYLDNIVFKRVQDAITVVKDSWVTPASCDRTINGIYSPQEMLGCKQYTTSQSQTVYLRSFNSLCRDAAVGCRAYSNTQNTADKTGSVTYGAVCSLAPHTCDATTAAASGGTNCPCDYSFDNPVTKISTIASAPQMILHDVCRVQLGETDCRFTLDGQDVQANIAHDFRLDRFTVPADQRMYLVVKDQNKCAATAVGCRNLGMPQMQYERQCKLSAACDRPIMAPATSSSFPVGSTANVCLCTDTLTHETCDVKSGETSCVIALEHGIAAEWKAAAIKDDPAKYDKILCEEKAVGCSQYSASDGTYYFKAPGSQLCEFKTNVKYEDRSVSGWFRQSKFGALLPCYGSYLKDGTIYGIYRNKDVNYAGWVGSCSAEYNKCEEFVDPLDVSDENPAGKAYYYLNDGKIDKSSCNGQVSLSAGCVLLQQTSNPQRLYSAAASYLRSQTEADDEMVAVVNCESNPRSQFCEKRCSKEISKVCVGYENNVCNENSDCGPAGICISGQCRTSCRETSDCNASGSNLAVCKGQVVWTNGCKNNIDCNQAVGESCQSAPYNGLNCGVDSDCGIRGICQCGVLSGMCYAPVSFPDPPRKIGTCSLPDSTNDSNIIVKVRRDRECAEWLECDKSQMIYDTTQNKWVNRCVSFGTCVNNTKIGEGLVCTEFKDEPRQMFTVKNYVNRSINWSGFDYSGYSIVNRYPLQYLWPYKVTSGYCRETGVDDPDLHTTAGEIVYCRTDNECRDACRGGEVSCTDEDNTYCSSSLNGVCIGGDYNGRPCGGDNHCQSAGQTGGYCSKSEFGIYRLGIRRSICVGGTENGKGTECTQNSDCAGGGSCTLTCTKDSDCPSDGYQTSCSGGDCPTTGGTCLENVCVYDFRGGPLIVKDKANAPSCRAYPEADSPFPATVLDTGKAALSTVAGTTPGYDEFGNPLYHKIGFKGANVCYDSNTCECSYVRAGYGQGGTKVRFYSADTSKRYRGNSETGRAAGQFMPGVAPGICVGGPFDGKTCTPGLSEAAGGDGQCGTGVDSGSCMRLSIYTTALGWPGFCVDRDSSAQLFADSEMMGCNLWLPTDLLPGLADSNSQHPEAGFQSGMNQMLMCAVADGLNRTSDLDAAGEVGRCSKSFDTICSTDTLCSTEDKGECLFYLRGLTADGGYGCRGGDSMENRLFFVEDQDEPLTDRDTEGNSCTATWLPSRSPDPYYRSEITQVVLEFRLGDGRAKILLNEENNFTFAQHYSESDSVPDEGNRIVVGEVTYLKNEAFDPTRTHYCTEILDEHGPDDGTDDHNEEGESRCEQKVGDSYPLQKCIAARVNWLGDGQASGFRNLQTTACIHGTDNEDRFPLIGVYMELRAECREVSIVDDSINSPSSVAFTNRLFNLKNGRGITGISSLSGLENYFIFPSYLPTLGVENTILGSIASAGSFDIASAKLAHPIPVVSAAVSDTENYSKSAGSPYYSGLHIDETAATATYPDIDSVLGYAIAAGFQFGCGANQCHWPEHVGNSSGLSDLFALRTNYRVNPTRDGYTLSGTTDVRSTPALAHSPQVMPVNTTPALCQNNGSICPELNYPSEGGISVNGQQRDMCFPGGHAANVEIGYYMKADSDHMPIRRQIIDFGDSGEPLRMEGSFKNARGLDASSKPICGSNSTDFGLSNDACDSNYVRYVKTYTCSDEYAASLPMCGVMGVGGARYPCQDAAGCCVFKPRVQIMDNWGYCNGNCPYSSIAGSGKCFNSSSHNYLLESTIWNSSDNNCTILSSAERLHAFSSGFNQPFTSYANVIVVCPGGCVTSGMTPWPTGARVGGGSCTEDSDCTGADECCVEGLCSYSEFGCSG